jgi:hypothetical protein
MIFFKYLLYQTSKFQSIWTTFDIFIVFQSLTAFLNCSAIVICYKLNSTGIEEAQLFSTYQIIYLLVQKLKNLHVKLLFLSQI